MATVYSEQLRNLMAKPVLRNGPWDDADLRQVSFDFIPRGEAASAVIVFGTLKTGWRLKGMRMVISTSVGLSNSTVSFGIVGSPTKYSAAMNWSVGDPLIFDFNNTAALNYGELLTDDADLIGTCNAFALGTIGGGYGRAIVTVNYTR